MANQRARQLRREMTDVERKLWRHLRYKQLPGHRFRRQVPLGVYIVDFACLDARLVVELDGGQHNEEVEIERDARRTAWLESQGFRVVRFWNFQVIEEIEEVIETIWLALSESTPHPNPPPQGGREILGPWRESSGCRAPGGVEGPGEH